MGSCKLGMCFSLYGCHCGSALNVHMGWNDRVPELVGNWGQLCVLGTLMGEQPCMDLLLPEVATRADPSQPFWGPAQTLSLNFPQEPESSNEPWLLQAASCALFPWSRSGVGAQLGLGLSLFPPVPCPAASPLLRYLLGLVSQFSWELCRSCAASQTGFLSCSVMDVSGSFVV